MHNLYLSFMVKPLTNPDICIKHKTSINEYNLEWVVILSTDNFSLYITDTGSMHILQIYIPYCISDADDLTTIRY